MRESLEFGRIRIYLGFVLDLNLPRYAGKGDDDENRNKNRAQR